MNNVDLSNAYNSAKRTYDLCRISSLGEQLATRRVLEHCEVDKDRQQALIGGMREFFLQLDRNQLKEARQLYFKLQDWLEASHKHELTARGFLNTEGLPCSEVELLQQASLFEKAKVALQHQDLATFDDCFKNIKGDRVLIELKAEKKQLLTKFLEETLPHYGNDQEKIDALAVVGQHILLSARAGSGKTSVLALKALSLMRHYNAKADEILVLAFNRNAAEEIGERISSYSGQPFATAMTFHALATRTIGLRGRKLLMDNDNPRKTNKERTSYVNQAFRSLLDEQPELEARLYTFLRDETEAFFKVGGMSDGDYYSSRYNLSYLTLNGEIVRSKGEKWIADFLFEHGVSYQYERAHKWDGAPYRPDFTLYDSGEPIAGNFAHILEHWAIDPNDSSAEVPKDWSVDTKTYKRQISDKRDYWRRRDKPLIETSTADMRKGREQFEYFLKKLLERQGISCQRRPQDELIKMVVRAEASPLEKQILSIVDIAGQQGWEPADIHDGYSQTCLNAREAAFRDVAVGCYEGYLALCLKHMRVDFTQLLIDFPDHISAVWETAEIGKDGGQRLASVKHILIDEYQDFSPAFYRVITAIKRHNTNIQIVAVGDDWQAINGFAGSDLSYFHNFSTHFSNAKHVSLLTNHRSDKAVVSFSNCVMKATQQAPALVDTNRGKGSVQIIPVGNKVIDVSSAGVDNRYAQPFFGSARILAADLLKTTHNIVSNYLRYEINTAPTILVLSRTNMIAGATLNTLEKTLKKLLSEELKLDYKEINLKVKTAHKAKGGQADLVIVLQVNEGNFPSVHPLSSLLFPLGKDLDMLIEEERRLFYVAVSRAHHHLRLLVQSDVASPFLSK